MTFIEYTENDIQRLAGQTLITCGGVILDKGDIARQIARDVKGESTWPLMALGGSIAPRKGIPELFHDWFETIMIAAYEKGKYEAGLEPPNVASWQEAYVGRFKWRRFPTVATQPVAPPKKRRKKAA